MNVNENRENRISLDPPAGFGRQLLRRGVMLLGLIIAALLLASAVVLVDETEYVLVERLGEIVAVYDRPEDRGLHFKLPWPVDVVRRFDRRVQLFDPPGREVFTRDKKNVIVDAYVCWRIAEPEAADSSDRQQRPVVRFFRGLGSLDVAEARLDSRVRSILGTRIGQVELSSLLSVEDSESGPAATPLLNAAVSPPLSNLSPPLHKGGPGGVEAVGDAALPPPAPPSKGVEKSEDQGGEKELEKGGEKGEQEQAIAGALERIADEVRAAVERRHGEAGSLREQLGIEIVDVRIKRLNLPAGNQQAVFERMKSERKKIADSYRSAGLAENRVIMSRADRQYNEVLSRARAEAERIRGEGEAEAIAILNRAHARDPEFYRVTRTLDTYRAILNEKTTLVLSASSNLLKLLTEGLPEESEIRGQRSEVREQSAGGRRQDAGRSGQETEVGGEAGGVGPVEEVSP